MTGAQASQASAFALLAHSFQDEFTNHRGWRIRAALWHVCDHNGERGWTAAGAFISRGGKGARVLHVVGGRGIDDKIKENTTPFRAPSGTISCGPRRASRGIERACENPQPHRGGIRSLKHRAGAVAGRVRTTTRCRPWRGSIFLLPRSFPRLARRGPNDGARYAGFRVRRAVILTPVGGEGTGKGSGVRRQ